MTSQYTKKIREALKQYTNVVSSINDPNDFTPTLKDEGIHAREALNALEKLEAELPSWQPIETAPRDGAYIFVGRHQNNGEWKVYISRWHTSGYWTGTDAHLSSHWLPLDALPQPPQGGDE